MKSRLSPEIPCVICSKSLDLSVDLSADANGKAVHTQCYANKTHYSTERHIHRYDGGLNS